MFRNEVLLVWILCYEAYCSELCVDRDGTILDCRNGCCGDEPGRYCCSFQIWIIIVFGIAAAAVLIPVAVIIYCCIRDKFCPRKPSVQANPARQAVQLRTMTQVPDSCNTTGSAAKYTSGSTSNHTDGSTPMYTSGSASVKTVGSTYSYRHTAGSTLRNTGGAASVNTAGPSSIYGGANPAYVHDHPHQSTARP